MNVAAHRHHSPWKPSTRAVASLVLIVYLAAVILPPLAGPPPTSELANWLIRPLRPFIGAMYLGHGYRFFAPDPGPGHSIEWTMRLSDGSSRVGVIPDAHTDRPRLLYHRRFMISEKIASFVPLLDAPEAIRVAARREWQPLIKGLAGHLLRQHRGEQVTLVLREHILPSPEEVIRAQYDADTITPLGTYQFPPGTRL